MTSSFLRQSHLFAPPQRSAAKDADSVSHRLLTQGGFIHQLSSGVFSLLPLGLRVHRKLETIIRQEMNGLGAQEVLLPSLQPRTLWEESGRWTTIDPPLFVVRDRHEKELALGPTHEEVITDLARTYVQSYKQLPVAVYQIQTKFRNELRATGGLLRVREFLMKDLYSFHTTEEDLARFYEEVKQAYLRIFATCGLDVVALPADSGSIGGRISHEFALVSPTGEDTILRCPSCTWAAKSEMVVSDLRTCPNCEAELEKRSCIENGHIFQLGVKYTQPMEAMVMNEEGKREYMYMGCYGIGVGRLLASCVEVFHDETGICWPPALAPFRVHILSLRADTEAERVAAILTNEGFDVLLDDRDASPGEKFTDSERIGVPVQIIVSERNGKEGVLELRSRRALDASERVSSTDVEALLETIRRMEGGRV